MSRTAPDEGERRMLPFECSTCGAVGGTWCTTDGSPAAEGEVRWATYLHEPRFRAATIAGYLPLREY